MTCVCLRFNCNLRQSASKKRLTVCLLFFVVVVVVFGGRGEKARKRLGKNVTVLDCFQLRKLTCIKMFRCLSIDNCLMVKIGCAPLWTISRFLLLLSPTPPPPSPFFFWLLVELRHSVGNTFSLIRSRGVGVVVVVGVGVGSSDSH